MRTVLVIASAIVKARAPSANTAIRTYHPGPHGGRDRAGCSPAVGASRVPRPATAATRRPPDPAALHAQARDAEPQVRALGRAPRTLEAAPAQAPAHGRPGVRGPGLQPRGEKGRDARARPLVLGGARLQDPLPRAHRLHRR